MSAVGGGADVACQGLSGPFIAITSPAAKSQIQRRLEEIAVSLLFPRAPALSGVPLFRRAVSGMRIRSGFALIWWTPRMRCGGTGLGVRLGRVQSSET